MQAAHSLGSGSDLFALLALRGVFLAVVEAGLVDVGDEAEPQSVAGVVQNAQVNLARRGAQAAADDLDVPDARLGRARVDQARRHRQIDAGHQNADVADDPR